MTVRGNNTVVVSIRVDRDLYLAVKWLREQHKNSITHSSIYYDGIRVALHKHQDLGIPIPEQLIPILSKRQDEIISEAQEEKAWLESLPIKGSLPPKIATELKASSRVVGEVEYNGQKVPILDVDHHDY